MRILDLLMYLIWRRDVHRRGSAGSLNVPLGHASQHRGLAAAAAAAAAKSGDKNMTSADLRTAKVMDAYPYAHFLV